MEAIEVLNVFYKSNIKREPREQVDYTIFYNDEINKLENLQEHYDEWLEQ